MLIELDAEVATCPTCNGPLGSFRRGRITGKWLRVCRTLDCATTAVSDAPSVAYSDAIALPRLNVPWALPFEGDPES